MTGQPPGITTRKFWNFLCPGRHGRSRALPKNTGLHPAINRSRQFDRVENRTFVVLRSYARINFELRLSSSIKMGGSVDRITPRYTFEARIRICVQRDSQNLAMEGWARDLSETGLSAFVARGLDEGELVTLEIPLPPSRRLSIPAKVVGCLGTQYDFQFTALSPDQRANIRDAVKDRPEVGAYYRQADANDKAREHRYPETSPSVPKQETEWNADSAFADRARMLIKRGYTPKVAVELVLHEIQVENGNNSTIMDKARVDAEAFLLKARRGLI